VSGGPATLIVLLQAEPCCIVPDCFPHLCCRDAADNIKEGAQDLGDKAQGKA
jgi:hypothetical protein